MNTLFFRFNLGGEAANTVSALVINLLIFCLDSALVTVAT